MSCSSFLLSQPSAKKAKKSSFGGKSPKTVCKCKTCGKVFPSLTQVLQHHWRKHRKRKSKEAGDKPRPLESGPALPFNCPYCRRLFFSSKGLKIHLIACPDKRQAGLKEKAAPKSKKVSAKVENGPFRCRKCNREFGGLKGLKIHMFRCDGHEQKAVAAKSAKGLVSAKPPKAKRSTINSVSAEVS